MINLHNTYLSFPKKGLLLLMLTLWSWSSYSQSALNTQAKAAYRQGQYQQALTLYTKAYQVAPTQTLLYNLAVCHYRLKQWPQAEELFQKLYHADNSHEKAQLNLALAQAKQGKYKQALKHLDWLSLAAESDLIANVAFKNYKLVSAEVSSPLIKEPVKSSDSSRWSLAASLGYGSDDNVYSVIDDTATRLEDRYWESNLSATWYNSRKLSNAWGLSSNLFTTHYASESDYDVTALSLGLRKNHQLAPLSRLTYRVQLEQTAIGGSDYMRSLMLQLAHRYKFSPTNTLTYGLRLQQSTELDQEYQGMAGTSYRLYGTYRKSLGDHQIRFKYRFDRDDKNDESEVSTEPEISTFTSYSANRHTYQVSWSYTYGALIARAYAQYRTSDYLDAHLFSDGSSKLREDRKKMAGLRLNYELSPSWDLELEWTMTKNSSTIEDYAYDQNILALTLSWQN